MATLPKAGAFTLLDFAKSLDPDGKTATVVELLNQSNEILLDMGWIEGNLPTGHRSTIRTGLPAVTWRQLYGGVQPSKSTRAQVDDSLGMLEARSEVDKDVIDLNGNTNEVRLSEADAFLEAMNQNMAQTIFYGDVTVNPERFTGMTARYNAISGAGNAQNVIDAGGTGSNNSSVWLIGWAPNCVTGIFPKGSKAGIIHEDLGLQDAFDANQNRFRAYCDHWQWKCGIVVRDWRYAIRIANINMTDMLAQTGTQAATAATALIKLMVKAMARIPAMGKCRPVFYANRTIKEMLAIAALDKSQNALKVEDAINQFGTVSPGSVSAGSVKFLGVPVRTVDQLLSTEARVV